MHQEVTPLTAGVMVAKPSGPIDPAAVPPCDSYESDMELFCLSRKKLVGFTSLIFPGHPAIAVHNIVFIAQ